MAGYAVAVLGLMLAAGQPPPARAPEPERSAGQPADAQAPSAELLLYLAEFADADGTTVDPSDLETAADGRQGSNAGARESTSKVVAPKAPANPAGPATSQKPKRPDDPPNRP